MPELLETAGDLESLGYEPETLMDTEAVVTPPDSEELREWVRVGARVRERPEDVWHGCAESNQIGF